MSPYFKAFNIFMSLLMALKRADFNAIAICYESRCSKWPPSDLIHACRLFIGLSSYEQISDSTAAMFSAVRAVLGRRLPFSLSTAEPPLSTRRQLFFTLVSDQFLSGYAALILFTPYPCCQKIQPKKTQRYWRKVVC